MLLWVLSVIVSILAVLHILICYNERARLLNKLPGPDYHFVLGNALHVLKSPVGLFRYSRKCTSQWDRMYRLWAPMIGVIHIYTPQDVEVIISTTKFNEKSFVYDFLRPWLQDGLLISKGQKWHERRKILTPAFHFNILQRFFAIIQENSKKLIEVLAASEGKLNVVPVIAEFTLTSICETAMGTQFSEEIAETAHTYKNAIYSLGNILIERLTRVLLHSDFIFSFTSLYREQMKCVKIIRNFTQKVIKERKEYLELNGYKILEDVERDEDEEESEHMITKRKRPAMLDLLLLAQKDGLISDQGIQEEVDTFMFEGHDTTSSGLTYCLMALAGHKDIQDKIFEELIDIFGNSDRNASYDDLNKMKYLECCIKESLRLYPPVPFIGRQLTEPITLGDYKIPANINCHIHVYDLHRHKDIYPNPLKFDPDRFLPENSVGRHPFAYIPFSAGPRNCIGQRFAMMEMKIVLSSIMRRFELEPVTTPLDLITKADLVLKNHGPIYVTIKKRKV